MSERERKGSKEEWRKGGRKDRRTVEGEKGWGGGGGTEKEDRIYNCEYESGST